MPELTRSSCEAKGLGTSVGDDGPDRRVQLAEDVGEVRGLVRNDQAERTRGPNLGPVPVTTETRFQKQNGPGAETPGPFTLPGRGTVADLSALPSRAIQADWA